VTELGDRDSDWEPDQAALDELQRAFAVDRAPAAKGERDQAAVDAAEDVRSNDDSSDHGAPSAELEIDDEHSDGDDRAPDGEELLIVEQEHMPEPIRNVIRIDDYGGSTPVDVVQPSDDTSRPVPLISIDSSSFEDPSTEASGSGEPRSAVSVVSIDDTDSPDAVYVEGSLDKDGTRTIVFIEDGDTDDSLVPESARDLRRGVDPRLRERRVAIKRAKGRRRFKWLLVGLGGLVAALGAFAILGSSLFAVQRAEIELTGNVYTDQDQLDVIIEDLVGTSIFRVDTREAERRIEAISWVESAKVQIRLRHSLKIEIREREAIATYRGPDDRFRVLDRDGRVLDVLDAYPVAYLLLGGPDGINLAEGEIAPAGYAAASELAKNVTGSIRGQIEIVEVTADGSSLVMRLNDGTEVRFGEARDIFAKLVRLETVLSSTEDREPGVIDVSTREVTL
jgi:cell division protein FtsQ